MFVWVVDGEASGFIGGEEGVVRRGKEGYWEFLLERAGLGEWWEWWRVGLGWVVLD